MQGVGGLAGWKWLFIVSVPHHSAYFILPDFPTTTKWLTQDEQNIAVARLQLDDLGQAQTDTGGSHWASLKDAFQDWRTYVSGGL
jgi:hypothetical protein